MLVLLWCVAPLQSFNWCNSPPLQLRTLSTCTTIATTAHFHVCQSTFLVFTGGVMKPQGAEKDETISSTEGNPHIWIHGLCSKVINSEFNAQKKFLGQGVYLKGAGEKKQKIVHRQKIWNIDFNVWKTVTTKEETGRWVMSLWSTGHSKSFEP